jgi:hypothetical protein
MQNVRRKAALRQLVSRMHIQLGHALEEMTFHMAASALDSVTLASPLTWTASFLPS